MTRELFLPFLEKNRSIRLVWQGNGYTTHQVGDKETEGYRLFFLKNGSPISPFHDIPLWADKAGHVANMVVEIPRGTHAKLEISRPLPLNPIKQDM
jgi:inorganic pyrophosphatase